MHAFSYIRVERIEDALAAARQPNSKFLAGGTNLLDLMKGYVEQPAHVVDITHLPLAGVSELRDGGVRIGALARNSDTANHPLIRQRYPLLSQASGEFPSANSIAFPARRRSETPTSRPTSSSSRSNCRGRRSPSTLAI